MELSQQIWSVCYCVSFWIFYDRIYTVGCDIIKITMATQQVRDATSLI